MSAVRNVTTHFCWKFRQHLCNEKVDKSRSLQYEEERDVVLRTEFGALACFFKPKQALIVVSDVSSKTKLTVTNTR